VRRSAPALLAALALAGCGRERLAVPGADSPVTTGPVAQQSFPQAGLRIETPTDWGLGRGPAPLVAEASSGTATIAIWRYPRTEPLPEDDTALDAAGDALLGAVRQRDRTYREVSSRRTEVAGEPAVVLVGDQRVAGQRRRVRSTHVFAHGAEVVIDQYAAPADFAAVDAAVFEPAVRSLRLGPPRR
jgi:hypothetical protein